MSLASVLNVIFDLSLAVLDIHNLYRLLVITGLHCFQQGKACKIAFLGYRETLKLHQKLFCIGLAQRGKFYQLTRFNLNNFSGPFSG